MYNIGTTNVIALACALQIVHFLQIEVFWQGCTEPIYQCHFSTIICLLSISVYFGNPCNASNSITFWHDDLWSVTMTYWKFRLNLTLFSIKVFLLLKNYVLFFERDRVQAREGQRERERQNPKQAPGSSCQHRAWHEAWTHKLQDHDLSRGWELNRLSHPGTPQVQYFIRESSVSAL